MNPEEVVLRIWHDGRLDGNAQEVIASAIRQAVEEEREACAKVMDFRAATKWAESKMMYKSQSFRDLAYQGFLEASTSAATIRFRSQAKQEEKR